MSRPTRPSIVPTMEAPPPSPTRMALILIGSSGAVGTGLAMTTLVIAPLVLALPGLTMMAVVRLAVAQSLIAWTALLAGTAIAIYRMQPIYTALRRGSRVDDRSAPPPVQATAAAFQSPERVVWAVTLSAQFIVLTDAFGWLSISGLYGWPRIALPLLAVAIACAGLQPSVMLWRAIVWRWLGRLHPDDVPPFAPRRLARRLALTATLPVGMVGVSAVVVLLSHLFAFQAQQRSPYTLLPSPWWTDRATPLYAALIALASTIATWLLVRRIGERSATDLVRLTEEIERVQRRGRPSTRAQLAVFELIPRTAAGTALGKALAELAGRFSEIAEQEQQAGRAMEGVRRLRTQFLASMSHDLRSPLNAIVGFADLVASGAEGEVTDEQRESVMMIHRSARDLLRLVNHILDWARLDAGRFEVAPDFVEAGELLEDVVKQARDILGEDTHQLRAMLDANVAELDLHVDRRRISEALLAVIEHAAAVMDRGEIELEAQIYQARGSLRRQLLVHVSDRGPGIRPTDEARVFQAFREIQDPSGKRVRGLGVGLAVAREVVRAHNGELSLSTRPGMGSTFTLSLPLELDEHAPLPQAKTLPPPG